MRPSRTSSEGWLIRAARFRRGRVGEIKNENKHVGAFQEGLGDAGSTPATSTILITVKQQVRYKNSTFLSNAYPKSCLPCNALTCSAVWRNLPQRLSKYTNTRRALGLKLPPSQTKPRAKTTTTRIEKPYPESLVARDAFCVNSRLHRKRKHSPKLHTAGFGNSVKADLN